MKLTVLSLLVTVVFFSCKKNEVSVLPAPVPAATPASLAASNNMNVSYGTDATQKMDVYLPAGRSASSTKLIIMIHGGGWTSGDKTDMTVYVDTLKRRFPSYAIININYRLVSATNNFFPTQENDVKAAVEFIYNKRNEYAVSDKFVLMGASAGAHLALLHAYKYNTPVKIKAVVDFFGPTDMAAMYNNPASIYAPPSSIAQLFNGATPVTNPTAYTQSSGLTFVTPQSPPTIILHGGQDPLVKPSQATALRDKLALNTVSNQYVFYPAESHGWIGANLGDSFDKIQAFLNLYVQ